MDSNIKNAFDKTRLAGSIAAAALDEVKKIIKPGITTNKNMIPYDQRSPLITSGIRLGTPALTTRGMGNKEMRYIAGLIHQVLSNVENQDVFKNVQSEVLELCKSFPLYSEMSYEMS